MRKAFTYIGATAVLGILANACGVFYGAGSELRTTRMQHALTAGETTLKVHEDWGEPDLRSAIDGNTEVWSYVALPNSNDIAASLLYTSTKPGDTDKFLDLKFVDGKLVSWNTVEHTMPAKKGTGFSYGLGASGGNGPVTHY
jgi:hypothetical protein